MGNLMTENEVSGGYKGEVRYFKLYAFKQVCGSSPNPRLRTALNKRK